MGYSEPYSAWFDAVKTALVDASAPFKKSGQVLYWEDDAYDDLAPEQKLIQALTRTIPHALLSWPGGLADPAILGGENSHEEEVGFTIRFGCGAPDEDYEKALKADGTKYWGAWAVHDWIFKQVCGVTVVGFNAPAELLRTSVIKLDQPGRIARRMDWRVMMPRDF